MSFLWKRRVSLDSFVDEHFFRDLPVVGVDFMSVSVWTFFLGLLSCDRSFQMWSLDAN